MDYILLITYLSVAIGFSFLCSIAEAVLLSIIPSYRHQVFPRLLWQTFLSQYDSHVPCLV